MSLSEVEGTILMKSAPPPLKVLNSHWEWLFSPCGLSRYFQFQFLSLMLEQSCGIWCMSCAVLCQIVQSWYSASLLKMAQRSLLSWYLLEKREDPALPAHG